MKLSIDTENNIGYLQFPDEIIAGGVHRTIMVELNSDSSDDNPDQIQIDLDAHGAILGFEFLDVETQLAALQGRLSSAASQDSLRDD